MSQYEASAVWPAPAKLNLLLHITGRRADGYHELQTVFQFVELCDALTFRANEDGRVRRLSGSVEISPEDDLVVRSARALKSATGTPLGVEIRVTKRIPAGAGLGGGSSDAATTLHALNKLWKLALDVDRLAAIGLTLGADVPVFVCGFAAFAEGVGERLQPVSPGQSWYLIITPDVHVSTAEIFADPDLTRDSPAIKICDLSACRWDNVCTPVVIKHYPEVARALELVGSVGEARMSGTGSSVFAQFASRHDAEQALQQLQAHAGWSDQWQAFICQGRNRSPLFEFMETL